jgi:hypothetical protein
MVSMVTLWNSLHHEVHKYIVYCNMESTKQNIKTRISCTFCINKYLMTTKTVHYNIVFIERPVGHTMIQPQILPASALLKLSLTRKPKLVQKNQTYFTEIKMVKGSQKGPKPRTIGFFYLYAIYSIEFFRIFFTVFLKFDHDRT